ncbi:MAG TPA: AMP-binding protein [Solirubrobacteraceae bacterium]|nr:AMP-binding protein [Solirubrobacteraceae bacterium]
MTGDLGIVLASAAARHAGAVAVVDGPRRVSYGELAARVARLGGLLDELGVAEGGRVGVLAHNSLAHLEWTLGAPAQGRVVVSLNIRLAEDELAALAADAGLEALLADATHAGTAARLAARCPGLRALLIDDGSYEARLAGARPAEPRARGGLAAISYTGGTTGRPKGVMLSHENLLANARHNAESVGHAADQRWLHVCPMFHVAGTANVLAATVAGARQVVLPRFDAGRVLATIEHEQITHVVLVPTMLQMLLEHPAFAEAGLASLRHVQYAASPIDPELQRRVLDALACEVEQFYGMTEAAPTVSRLSAEEHRRGRAGEVPFDRRLWSVGRPVCGVEVEIRAPGGGRAAVGEVGELCVRGPNVMLGYWQRPQETAAALVDGWYRTGDAGYADEGGYLFLVDRLKDMIVTGGENVYSAEVERALCDHPRVREAAVFAVPDARWGEAVHAVVVTDGALDEHELLEHCRARIAGYKVPRGLELRREPLPRSGAGKVLKHVLRQPWWAGRERQVS